MTLTSSIMPSIVIPEQYSLVLAVASSSFLVNLYHGLLTSRCRRAAGIKYPAPYATPEQAEKDPKAFAFNCAQRAHSNFTENHASAMGAMLIAGLHYPVAAAVMGSTWVVARVLYAAGYTSNGPQGRIIGFVSSFAAAVLMKGMAIYTSAMMVMKTRF